jgi:hypothetical protein
MSLEERVDNLEADLADVRRRLSRSERAAAAARSGRVDLLIDESTPVLVEIRDLLRDGLGGIRDRLEHIEQLLRERGTDGPGGRRV